MKRARLGSVKRLRLGDALARPAMWLPLAVSCFYVVAFSAWTVGISLTRSSLLPDYRSDGWRNYSSILASRNWQIAYGNLYIYGIGFLGLATLTGLSLAILIDQRIRGEALFRTKFLAPIAISFVVTGTIWCWLFNPTIGLQKLANYIGWTGFRLDWTVNRDMAIYYIVVAAVWHGSGFAMALFLAGLRSVDSDLLKAAQIDGAGAWRTYMRAHESPHFEVARG